MEKEMEKVQNTFLIEIQFFLIEDTKAIIPMVKSMVQVKNMKIKKL